MVGIWFNISPTTPATSSTPITDPEVFRWISIDVLYPHVDVYDTGTPVSVVTWKPRPGLIESFAQAKASTTEQSTLWVAWEVSDPSGLINATGTPITYPMAAQGQVSFLIDTP